MADQIFVRDGCAILVRRLDDPRINAHHHAVARSIIPRESFHRKLALFFARQTFAFKIHVSIVYRRNVPRLAANLYLWFVIMEGMEITLAQILKVTLAAQGVEVITLRTGDGKHVTTIHHPGGKLDGERFTCRNRWQLQHEHAVSLARIAANEDEPRTGILARMLTWPATGGAKGMRKR